MSLKYEPASVPQHISGRTPWYRPGVRMCAGVLVTVTETPRLFQGSSCSDFFLQGETQDFTNIKKLSLRITPPALASKLQVTSLSLSLSLALFFLHREDESGGFR